MWNRADTNTTITFRTVEKSCHTFSNDLIGYQNYSFDYAWSASVTHLQLESHQYPLVVIALFVAYVVIFAILFCSIFSEFEEVANPLLPESHEKHVEQSYLPLAYVLNSITEYVLNNISFPSTKVKVN